MAAQSLTLAAQRAYSATLGRGAFCVAVTSTSPEAGGSGFALAMAEAGADFGKTILLVGAASLAPGSDISPAGKALFSCTQTAPSGHLELQVIANGVLHRSLNDRARFANLLAGWEAQLDGVILDLPPYGVGAGVYTPLAASAAGALLLVTLPGVTESHVMGEALKWLADSGANLSGLVLNDCRNPTLAQEVVREAGRLKSLFPFAPKLAERLVARWGPLHRHH